MKKWLGILGIILICFGLSACELLNVVVTELMTSAEESVIVEESIVFSEESSKETIESLNQLANTEYFSDGSLEHIFHGEINGRGQAVGYHTEALEDTPGEIITGTKSNPNTQGVYTAQVTVDDVKKTANKGYSTFFPEEWSAQEVVDAINQAYDNRQFDSGNTYLGESDSGVIIQMYLTGNDKIISAFPVY